MSTVNQHETMHTTTEEMPPGFRFYPTEEELVSFYLHNKLEGKNSNIDRVIPLLDIYQLDPWQLPNHCGERCHGDTEQWFFFMPRRQNEVRGGRPSRTTASGYWKATGSLSYVYSSADKVIGIKKSMVFYKGKAPTGRKTKWKMNEYKAIEEDLNTSTRMLRHELSLCRVYVVSGTFRAFDRRPTHVITGGSSSRNVEIGQESDRLNLSANEHNNEIAPLSMQESCSSESSFSGGDCNVGNAVVGGSTSWEMIGDDLDNIKWDDI